jgi:hypothetical protein
MSAIFTCYIVQNISIKSYWNATNTAGLPAACDLQMLSMCYQTMVYAASVIQTYTVLSEIPMVSLIFSLASFISRLSSKFSKASELFEILN